MWLQRPGFEPTTFRVYGPDGFFFFSFSIASDALFEDAMNLAFERIWSDKTGFKTDDLNLGRCSATNWG